MGSTPPPFIAERAVVLQTVGAFRLTSTRAAFAVQDAGDRAQSSFIERACFDRTARCSLASRCPDRVITSLQDPDESDQEDDAPCSGQGRFYANEMREQKVFEQMLRDPRKRGETLDCGCRR